MQMLRSLSRGVRLRLHGAELRMIRRLAPLITRSFHLLFYDAAHSTWRDTTWLGLPVWKSPLDLWVYQEIIHTTRPDLLIETGSLYGGSARFFAHIFELMGHGEVLTVDTQPLTMLLHPRVTALTGSSTDPEITAQIQQHAQGKRCMVVLDSDHRQSHVARELELYHELVSVGCYLVVEDTSVNGHPVLPSHGPGPWEALHDFLRTHPQFSSDRACEKYLMTFFPRGFLRRIG